MALLHELLTLSSHCSQVDAPGSISHSVCQHTDGVRPSRFQSTDNVDEGIIVCDVDDDVRPAIGQNEKLVATDDSVPFRRPR